jgi:pyridoxal phosphate enzyme (YggS family)
MGAITETTIRDRYSQALERMDQAARASGRDPGEVRLVVVTKGHPLPTIRAVIEAGVKRLGENYVDEAVEKMEALRQAELGGPAVEWHMIGHVQSRKAKLVSEQFAWLHSLDSLKLASRLDRFSAEQARRLPALLECNVSGEETKFGLPAFEEREWEMLLPEVEAILALPNLQVRGLMTMAPFSEDPEQARPYFRRLRRLLEFVNRKIPSAGWDELSMGMSADYEAAVQEGATLVRIGTSFLGERPRR